MIAAYAVRVRLIIYKSRIFTSAFVESDQPTVSSTYPQPAIAALLHAQNSIILVSGVFDMTQRVMNERFGSRFKPVQGAVDGAKPESSMAVFKNGGYSIAAYAAAISGVVFIICNLVVFPIESGYSFMGCSYPYNSGFIFDN